jgi:hypothetical protein
MRHHCDLKGGIGGLRSFCDDSDSISITERNSLSLFFYEETARIF